MKTTNTVREDGGVNVRHDPEDGDNFQLVIRNRDTEKEFYSARVTEPFEIYFSLKPKESKLGELASKLKGKLDMPDYSYREEGDVIFVENVAGKEIFVGQLFDEAEKLGLKVLYVGLNGCHLQVEFEKSSFS